MIFFNKLYDIFNAYSERGQPEFVNYLSERYYMSGDYLDSPIDVKYIS